MVCPSQQSVLWMDGWWDNRTNKKSTRKTRLEFCYRISRWKKRACKFVGNNFVFIKKYAHLLVADLRKNSFQHIVEYAYDNYSTTGLSRETGGLYFRQKEVGQIFNQYSSFFHLFVCSFLLFFCPNYSIFCHFHVFVSGHTGSVTLTDRHFFASLIFFTHFIMLSSFFFCFFSSHFLYTTWFSLPPSLSLSLSLFVNSKPSSPPLNATFTPLSCPPFLSLQTAFLLTACQFGYLLQFSQLQRFLNFPQK